MSDQTYVFAEIAEQQEFERLRLQERGLDWLSMGALMSLGLRRGARCLEAGVGAGSMVRWMASQVDTDGRVVGVDVNDRMFPTSQGPNVELVKGDLRSTDIDDTTFDFVHCRLLLMHLSSPDRQLVLRRLFNALRAGGWIVALDPALKLRPTSRDSRPEELFHRYCEALLAATSSRADFAFGPALPAELANAGFVDIEEYGFFPYSIVGGAYAEYLVNTIETAGPTFIVEAGLMTSDELREIVEAIKSGEISIGYPGTIVWGRRPPNT